MKFLKLLFIFLVLFSFSRAFSATLEILPTTQSTNVGNIVNISVSVSSTDKAINAVSGTLSFPKDLLEVTSISKTGSLVNFWVNGPKFSNSDSTVFFEGVIMDPGFTGRNGKILKINFRAKQEGKATLKLSDVSVLANDGLGTNIFDGTLSSGFIEIAKSQKKPEPKEEVTPPVEGIITPEEPTETMPKVEEPEKTVICLPMTLGIIILLGIVGLLILIVILLIIIFKLRKNDSHLGKEITQK